MLSNYTFQDIFGSLLAVALFTMVFVFPGYVIGWWLNIFEFRKRLPSVKIIMGVTLSNAISPILVFLIYRFASSGAVIGALSALTLVWAVLHFWYRRHNVSKFVYSLQLKKYQKLLFLYAISWVVFSVLMLVEVQIGNRLYFANNSYDLITRVSMVDAITRTGVPPINPSYFPGYPIRLNYLYYFWYVLGSVIDQIGGSWVTAYHAMIASISWCGISIASTIATYMRLRNNALQKNPWEITFRALKFLAIGGLDFIMVVFIMAIIKERFGHLPFEGRIEGWNMPIMSWMNAVTWVPHHVAAALACLTALMLSIYYTPSPRPQKLIVAVLIGCAFASAFGLSVWGMVVFAVFWIVWMVVIYFRQRKFELIFWMAMGGIIGILLALPFIKGLFFPSASSYSGGGVPVAFYVRPFIVSMHQTSIPRISFYAINFLLLPLNYFLELGFFFLVAWLWIGSHVRNKSLNRNPYYVPEVVLIVVITIMMSFFYSNIISINDLGIRGWLPLQLILIVWAGDVIESRDIYKINVNPKFIVASHSAKVLNAAIKMVLVVGLLTTSLEVLSLRMWTMLIDMSVVGFPNELSSDTQLGERTFFGRLTYDFLRNKLPTYVITQSNPLNLLDHSSGVYGTHQTVVAFRTSYGISPTTFNRLLEDVSVIFTDPSVFNWHSIDNLCVRYKIEVLIFSDTDPIWKSLNLLEEQRIPLYRNVFNAVFSCGSYNSD